MGPINFKKGGTLMKAICLFMIQAFLLSSVAFAVPTTNATDTEMQLAKQKEVISQPDKMLIPRDAGLIKSKFSGKSGRLIVHIQDAHCNFEAQSNIAKIIETLVKNYNLNFVAVEGADGVVDTSWFKAFPDEDVRKEVATYFMKKGEITGPEFLSITTNYPIKLFGAETRAYYIENLNAFTSSYPLKEATEKYYNTIKAAINKLKGYIYSEELKALDQKMADYESKKIQFNDYVRLLQGMAEKHKINLREYDNFFKLVNTLIYEKKINFETVDKERSMIIDELSKGMPKDQLKNLVEKSLMFKASKISSAEYYDYLKGISTKSGIDIAKKYPNLSNYIIYNSVYSKIENELLFKDIKKLELAIKDKLFKSDDQRTLEALSRHIDILIGLVNIKLLNDDYGYFETHKEEFTHEYFADFITKKGTQYGLAMIIEPPSDAVAKAIPKLEEFYTVAIKRDNALVENTLKQMEADKQDIGVLVTGGFHSEGIAKLLEKQGVSYAVICPSITKDVPTPYIQILTNQRTSFEDILVSAVDAKKAMLAPAVIAWMAGLSEPAIQELKRIAVAGDNLEQRLNDIKNAWTLLDAEIWLGRALEVATANKLAQDIDVMKQAFAKAMEVNIAAQRPNGQLTQADRDLMEQIINSREFNAAFAVAYAKQLETVLTKISPQNVKTPGLQPGVQLRPAAPGVNTTRVVPETPGPVITSAPQYDITRGQAYSTADAFNRYVAQQMQALLKAVPGLEDMIKEYLAMPVTNKDEKEARDKRAKEIDTLIRLNYNAMIASQATGFDFAKLSNNNVVTKVDNLTDFVKLPEATRYFSEAEVLMVSPSIGKIDVFAGAASRLFGIGQTVDPTLSYAAHDVYAVAISRGQNMSALEAKGAIPGISMATRLAIQEWINLEEKLQRYYQAKGTLKSRADIVKERQDIIYETPRVVIVNDESGPFIINEFVNNNFYGYNPELVAFVVQPTRRGFDIENGVAKIVDTTKPIPAGHGDATMQVVQEGRAFTIDTNGKVVLIRGDAVTYLMDKTNGKTKLFIQSRVNDMIKLDTPVTDNPAVPVKDIDLGILALSLYKMGDIGSLSTGNNAVFEMVGQDSKDPMKGGTTVESNNKQVLIESLAQDDNLEKIIKKNGVLINRFYVFYKPLALTNIVKLQGFPIYFRFRDGFIYPETVTSDATMLNGTNAGFSMELTRKINDYKDGDVTLNKGIEAALKQDNNPLFRDYVGQLQTGRKDIKLTGLENAPGLAKEEPKAGDAITVTGQPLTAMQNAEINAVIKNAFETANPQEAAVKKDLPKPITQGLETKNISAPVLKVLQDLEVYVIPGLTQFDNLLVAHPGRGGEAIDRSRDLARVYVSPLRYDWVTNLPQDAQAEFWAHEAQHIASKRAGELLSEEAVQKLAPIDKVIAAAKAQNEAVVEKVDELSAIRKKFDIDRQVNSLDRTLGSILSDKGVRTSRKVIIAYDTGLDPNPQDPKKDLANLAILKLIDVIKAKGAAEQVIVVRGKGEQLLDAIQAAQDKLTKERTEKQELGAEYYPIKVVTLAGDATYDAAKAANKEANLGTVINIEMPGNRQLPIIGLVDLALKIAYELKDRDIMDALQRIALTPDSQPFTAADIEKIKKGFIRILPRIQRIDTGEAERAYHAAAQALKSL